MQIKNDSWPQLFVEHYLPKTLSLDHSEGRRTEKKVEFPLYLKSCSIASLPISLSPPLLRSTIQLNLHFTKKSYLTNKNLSIFPLSHANVLSVFTYFPMQTWMEWLGVWVGPTWVGTPLTICQCARQESSHSSPYLGLHKITYYIKHTTCHLISFTIPSLRLLRKQPLPLYLPF